MLQLRVLQGTDLTGGGTPVHDDADTGVRDEMETHTSVRACRPPPQDTEQAPYSDVDHVN